MSLPAITNLAATRTGAQVALTWSAVPGAPAYAVYRQTPAASAASIIAITTTNFHTDGLPVDLQADTTLTYKVYSYEAGTQLSPASNEVTVALPPYPKAPTDIKAAAGDKYILLSWTSSLVDIPDSYLLKARPLGTVRGPAHRNITTQPALNPTSSPATIKFLTSQTNEQIVQKLVPANGNEVSQRQVILDGLLNGVVYEITITANPAGPESTTVLAEHMVPVPAKPKIQSMRRSDGAISLKWTMQATAAPVKSYNVEIENVQTSQITRHTVPPVAEYTVSGLTNGTNYRFRLAANYETHTGTQSNQTDAISPANVIADAIRITSYNAGKASATVEWESTLAATAYTLTVGSRRITGVTSPYTVEGLRARVPYSITVEAVDADKVYVSDTVEVTPIHACSSAGMGPFMRDLCALMDNAESAIRYRGKHFNVMSFTSDGTAAPHSYNNDSNKYTTNVSAVTVAGIPTGHKLVIGFCEPPAGYKAHIFAKLFDGSGNLVEDAGASATVQLSIRLEILGLEVEMAGVKRRGLDGEAFADFGVAEKQADGAYLFVTPKNSEYLIAGTYSPQSLASSVGLNLPSTTDGSAYAQMLQNLPQRPYNNMREAEQITELKQNTVIAAGRDAYNVAAAQAGVRQQTSFSDYSEYIKYLQGAFGNSRR